MPIDPIAEELISLRDAARLLPGRRRGKKPSISCLYRWTTAGCRGVVLESVNVGGTRCTSRQALARFIARLSTKACAVEREQVPSVRMQPLERIDQELDAAGL
jgi:hypothetical protein